MPRRILNEQELRLAQDIIIKIRNEINRLGKQPKEFFDRYKQSQASVSLPIIQFKMALAELGPVGQSITADQFTILSCYLVQEVPNEISLNKLKLALTLT